MTVSIEDDNEILEKSFDVEAGIVLDNIIAEFLSRSTIAEPGEGAPDILPTEKS